jgi:gamma-glutamyltranspeptidase/glutathione hydrolase
LPWADLAKPAAKFAREGYKLSKYLHGVMEDEMDVLASHPYTTSLFLDSDGIAVEEGSVLKFPQLAVTLDAVSTAGREAIYGPAGAAALAADLQQDGSLITAADLMAYKAIERPPLSSTYRGYEILFPPPATAGGITLANILRLLEPYDLKKLGSDSPEFIALITAAQERAYAASEAAVGDPNFVPDKSKELLGDAWLKQARADMAYTPDRATTSPSVSSGTHVGLSGMLSVNGPLPPKQTREMATVANGSGALYYPYPDPKEPVGNTTSFMIWDAQGNIVCQTQTINTFFGSGITGRNSGLLMNNELFDFTAVSGHPNAPEPGKRPRSSIAPFLIRKDGKVIAAVATPGGSRIPMALAQVVVQVIDFGLPLQDAINAPRVFHDGIRGRLAFEKRIPETTMAQAQLLFKDPARFRLDPKPLMDKFFGGVQGIWMMNGKLTGGADPRRAGVAAVAD